MNFPLFTAALFFLLLLKVEPSVKSGLSSESLQGITYLNINSVKKFRFDFIKHFNAIVILQIIMLFSYFEILDLYWFGGKVNKNIFTEK